MAAVPAAAAHLLVGSQTLEADQFADLGVVDTASWLMPQWRGRGVGREMRAAVLHLAFAELGAVAAVTSAWHDNHASLGVSRSLADLATVDIAGLRPCLPLFGLSG